MVAMQGKIEWLTRTDRARLPKIGARKMMNEREEYLI
jgi:hypothetical protein